LSIPLNRLTPEGASLDKAALLSACLEQVVGFS
jgi:hypothetical protein